MITTKQLNFEAIAQYLSLTPGHWTLWGIVGYLASDGRYRKYNVPIAKWNKHLLPIHEREGIEKVTILFSDKHQSRSLADVPFNIAYRKEEKGSHNE